MIDDGAFRGNLLEEVDLTKCFSLRFINSFTFFRNKLKRVRVGDNSVFIKDFAFSGFHKHFGEDFEGNQIKDLELLSGIVSISQHAFSGNLLEKVTIPSSVSSIEKCAFYDNRLKEVVIEGALQEVGDYAFSSYIPELGGKKDGNPISLLTISKSIQNLGKGAFPETLEIESELFEKALEED